MLAGDVDLFGNVHVDICVSSRICAAEFRWLSAISSSWPDVHFSVKMRTFATVWYVFVSSIA